MSGDSRKDFILATAGNFFGISVNDLPISSLYNSSALNSFLDDGNCNVLAARAGDDQKVTLANKVGRPAANSERGSI